ncbi:hypothetical protein [Halobacillus sp. Marseille-Q1614]|uniref:hypothetical protein n=1 Tax=Halobacillus sp. Marseille-Q1614 TaxID=2709134 RepID=UPI001570F50D|nr:hypothetical protein [Halobacillus sp. Marseille-Q1614]
MHQYKLYNIKDIEQLKRKLAIYEQAIETKDHSPILDYQPKEKDDSTPSNAQHLKSKGDMKVMEENFEKRMAEYRKEDSDLSDRVDEISATVRELKQDIYRMLDKLDLNQINRLADKVSEINQNQYIERRQINSITEQITELQEQISPLNSHAKQQAPAPRQSEYRQLQNMLQSSRYSGQDPVQRYPNMPERQNFSYVRNRNNSSRATPPSAMENTLHKGNTQKRRTFQQNPSQVNKNIITSKNQSGKKKAEPEEEFSHKPFSSVADDAPSTINKEPLMGSPVKENVDRSQNVQQEQKPVAFTKPSTSTSQSFSQDNAKSSTEHIKKTSSEQDSSVETEDKKLEFASLFSIFQKKG